MVVFTEKKSILWLVSVCVAPEISDAAIFYVCHLLLLLLLLGPEEWSK